MRRSHAGGYSLVVVLWLLVLLTVVTLSYQASARVESKLLAQSINGARAAAAAEGGLWLAAHEFFAVIPSNGEPLPATAEVDVALNDIPVRVAFSDVAGKVNLNGAPPELLESLLASLDVPAAQRAALVASILDWRDADHVETPGGAEDAAYAGGGKTRGAKDAPFATVDELHYLPAMTNAAFERIAPVVTVLGNQGMVNVDAAPAEVLRALADDDRSVVDRVLRTRGSAAAFEAMQRLDLRFASSGTTSDIWLVTATAAVAGATARIIAALRYARSEAVPLQVLSWETGL